MNPSESNAISGFDSGEDLPLLPPSQDATESLVSGSDARTQSFRGLISAAAAAGGAALSQSIQADVAPLFLSSAADSLFGRFCEALAARLQGDEPVTGAPVFLREIAAEVRNSEELSTDAISEILRVQQRLLGAPLYIAERLEILPHAAAVALSRPELSGKRAADSLKLLGDILLLAPSSVAPHHLLRDLLPILGQSVHSSDLRLFSALLRSDGSPKAIGLSYNTFIAVCPRLKGLGGEVWSGCKAAALAAIERGFQDVRLLIQGYSALVEANCPRHAQRAYLLAMAELSRDQTAPHHGSTAALLASVWSVSPPPSRACLDLLAFLEGSNKTGLYARLGRLTSCCFERVASDEVHWKTLLEAVGIERKAPGSSARHEIFRAISDLQRGYASSLACDLRRLPGETVSPLARAALSVGDLQLVHSDDFRSFPGHGILISGLSPEKIFANLGRTQADVVHSLRRNLSAVSRQVESLAGVSILVSPGIFILRPPDGIRLTLSPKDRRSFSLLVFSHEHRQPSLVKALLVDTRWLMERVEPCLKEWRPTWTATGPQQVTQDLAVAGLRPEEVLACNRPGRVIALDIASPLALLGGFAYSLPVFNSPESPVRRPPRSYQRTGDRINEYLAKVLRYADAFRLAHANIHKGLSLQASPTLDYSIQPSAEETVRPGRELDTRLTPLIDALKLHHALVKDDGRPLPTDWCLVSANSLRYSDPPDGDFLLDCRTLESWVDNLPYTLFQAESRAITPLTRERWLRLFEQRFDRSAYQDLRFVERRLLQRR